MSASPPPDHHVKSSGYQDFRLTCIQSLPTKPFPSFIHLATMGKGTKDPRKPSAQYLASNPGSTSQIPSKATKAVPNKDTNHEKATGEDDVLRKVIRELGGDDEDYELVKGVDDDAEMDDGEVEVVAEAKKGKSEKVSVLGCWCLFGNGLVLMYAFVSVLI
jgi:hypothetical protein